MHLNQKICLFMVMVIVTHIFQATSPAIAHEHHHDHHTKQEATMTIEKIEKSEDEWRKILTPEEFRVLRKHGTEKSFSSPLDKNYEPGLYVCSGCGLALFESAHKYDSGTGWPSFWQPIEGHIGTKPDNFLWYERTEYHCIRCGGHQGHVFNDGPQDKTGKRYCNNGVALRFIPEDQVESYLETTSQHYARSSS